MLGKILGENSVSVIIKKHYYTYVIILELDIEGDLLLSPKNRLTFHRRIDLELGAWLRLWSMIISETETDSNKSQKVGHI